MYQPKKIQQKSTWFVDIIRETAREEAEEEEDIEPQEKQKPQHFFCFFLWIHLI